MLHIKFTAHPFDKLVSQLAIVTTFADERPLSGTAALLDWRLNGRLSRLIIESQYQSDLKELLLMPAEGRIGSKAILVCGLGRREHFSEAVTNQYIQFILETIHKQKITDFIISFSDIITDRFEWRNSVRLFVSKIYDYPAIERVRLCETQELVVEAKKRHMDFGMNVEVSFEANAA